jgi:nucleotide-binding universal stress UspA family protein
MGEVLGLPVRTVHVAPGPGLRGEARRSALARVERGESTEVPGRPEDVIASLVEARGTDLTVLGARHRQRRPGGRRAAGTAIAVARRVTRPLLFVPPGAEGWGGPGRVLTPLDGTGITAMTAASALAAISRHDTIGIPLHVVDDTSAHRFWGGPADEFDTWRQEFHSRVATEVAAPPEVRTGPVGRHVLQAVASTDADLVVLVWSRRTRGGHGAAVLDVLASSPVPVLLVPVQVPG